MSRVSDAEERGAVGLQDERKAGSLRLGALREGGRSDDTGGRGK